MFKHFVFKFLVRWGASSLGLFIASGLLGSNYFGIGDNFSSQILVAGLILAVVNMALKPLLIVLSFPAIILSLGLFMLVVNGLVILIASWIDSAIYVRDFGIAVVVGLILSLVNLLVSRVLKEFK